MISDTSKYALQILAHLAKNPHKLLAGEEISKETHIPANYLGKILNQLRKSGFVESQKGWGGGFSLRSAARKRAVADVLTVFEGKERLKVKKCAFGLPRCGAVKPCALHDYWAKVQEVFSEMIANVRIEDLAADGKNENTK
jgi:Rrf2 family transcriptional regulator, iron-sulfur cluster assembly transcription factor